MSERLKDLQRQRALAQEQLAWIDAEIAKETGRPAPPPAQPAVPRPRPPTAPSAAASAQLAEDILANYRTEATDSPAKLKRGCYILFALAFALLGLAVTALYFYSASRH